MEYVCKCIYWLCYIQGLLYFLFKHYCYFFCFDFVGIVIPLSFNPSSFLIFSPTIFPHIIQAVGSFCKLQV